MANKLFSFSKQEIYFLKKTLPSCKLNAYQIPLFQSIIESLETPVIPNEVISVPTPKEHLTIPLSPISEPVVDRSSYFQSPGVQTSIPQTTPVYETSEPIEQDPCPTPQFNSSTPSSTVEESIPNSIITPETIPISEDPQPIIENEPENIFEVIDKRT